MDNLAYLQIIAELKEVLLWHQMTGPDGANTQLHMEHLRDLLNKYMPVEVTA